MAPSPFPTPITRQTLKKYIKGNYAEGDDEKYSGALEQLQQLRNDVERVKNDTESGFDTLRSYIGQLHHMSTRFPISESNASIKLGFSWHDAFKPSKKIARYNINYEIMSVVFNLGALFSQKGLHTDRSTPEGLKEACQLFTQAAGVFVHVRDELTQRLPGPFTSDCTPEGLSMIINLMLAQAQSCFYERALQNKMKLQLVAKLAAQAAHFFNAALECTKSPSLEPILNKAWAAHIEFQHHMYNAAALFKWGNYMWAQAEEEAAGYGAAIATLQQAHVITQTAQGVCVTKTLGAGEASAAQALGNSIAARVNECSKDNNSLYYEAIPSAGGVATVGLPAAGVVKPVPMAANPDVPDLFEGLVHAEVNTAMQRYKEAVKVHIESIDTNAKTQSQHARDELQHVGLPASIEAQESNASGLPDSVWGKIESVLQRGGPGALAQMARENATAATQAQEQMKQAGNQLRQEEKDDSECRMQFGAQWDRTPSDALSASLMADFDRFTKLLADAMRSDQVRHILEYKGALREYSSIKEHRKRRKNRGAERGAEWGWNAIRNGGQEREGGKQHLPHD
jgi:programmed cell death 6-interacting protein